MVAPLVVAGAARAAGTTAVRSRAASAVASQPARAASATEADLAESRSLRDQNRVKEMRRQKIRRTDVKKAEEEAEEAERNKPSLLLYMPAFVLAAIKDLLDWVLIGSLPVIGTIITFMFGITIFLCLLLVKTNGSVADSRFVIWRAVIMLCGTAAEGFIFGLNFLPIQTIVILIIFLMDRHLSQGQIDRFNDIAKQLRSRKVAM